MSILRQEVFLCYYHSMFKEYDGKIKKIILEKTSSVDWKEILKYHQKMILRIQHERLVHLLVTIFAGLVMTATVFIVIITQKADLLALALILLVLFAAYLLHYRFLENTTQEWYKIEDKISSMRPISK
jgi:hypothetical protein